LESAKNNPKLKRFIHVSTDEVYGETPKDAESGYTEGQILNPTNPYSATKAAAEMLVTAYAHSYKLPVIITRGNNVYGPGQFPEKLIPKFCMRAMRGERLPVHGEGKAVRSYLYIDDVVEAFDIILHMGKEGETYNIGTKKERSVMDVAEEICNVFGLNKEETIQFVEDRPFNDCRYFIEDAKLAALGWTEKTTWTDGIKKTLAFYRDAASIWWKKSLVNEALNN
jgi:UDP-glucose 4,6-dehydratase